MEKILICGKDVEASLTRSGVALTMGGEPTFVPESPAGAEWQTAALGPTKLGYARRLARKLIERSFPGAVVIETSGKHYPGEPLPRWTLLIQRLADGTPLWRNPTLLRANTDHGGHRPAVAKKLIQALARKLSLAAPRVLPLAESAHPQITVGYVLPLDQSGDAAWITDDWRPTFGATPLTLFPGESPAGLRLPLAQLGENNLRRALTIEARDGILIIFVPPLLLPAYARLLTAIEDTLAALKIGDIVLSGYAPPADPELPTIGLASDPGVLEINVSPCATWAEYDLQLEQLYGAAHAVGLCARKLQYNGLSLIHI
mgnify:CR=1 FL=1